MITPAGGVDQMTAQNYFAAPGLSFSGMVDLAVSPLRYWHLHIRPDREPEEATPAMVFGSALHCAVLEPDQFERRYAQELDPADYCEDSPLAALLDTTPRCDYCGSGEDIERCEWPSCCRRPCPDHRRICNTCGVMLCLRCWIMGAPSAVYSGMCGRCREDSCSEMAK